MGIFLFNQILMWKIKFWKATLVIYSSCFKSPFYIILQDVTIEIFYLYKTR